MNFTTVRCLGILGSGISHSLSPLIHNYSAAQLGMDCVYLAFDSEAKVFPGTDFFRAMWDFGAVGFNITVPFKEDAARMFPGAGLGSVNTLYRGKEGWQAASTDAPGFLLGLAQLGKSLEDFPAIILLGNGGAARALYDHFLRVSEKTLFILRRTAARDATWQRPEGRGEFLDLTAETLADVVQRHPGALLIQTTSAPLQGDGLDHLLPGLDDFSGTLVDLVYGKTSALLAEAKAKGLPAQDGLPMLIGQALLAQKLWWDVAAEFEDIEMMLRSLPE